MNDERKFLENLLKDRLNFFLVFSSFVIAGIVAGKNISPGEEQIALVAAVFVSTVFFYALVRTNVLINRTLHALENQNSCYKKIVQEPFRYLKWRVNDALMVIPILIVLLFAALTVNSFAENGCRLPIGVFGCQSSPPPN